MSLCISLKFINIALFCKMWFVSINIHHFIIRIYQIKETQSVEMKHQIKYGARPIVQSSGRNRIKPNPSNNRIVASDSLNIRIICVVMYRICSNVLNMYHTCSDVSFVVMYRMFIIHVMMYRICIICVVMYHHHQYSYPAAENP